MNVEMNIVLLESLGIPDEVLGAYVARLTKTDIASPLERRTDEKELITRSKDADILMLANMPLSATSFAPAIT
jgi:D-3-phosphoglycerate dehydrogenase